jgi:signal transduction histidine kinase
MPDTAPPTTLLPLETTQIALLIRLRPTVIAVMPRIIKRFYDQLLSQPPITSFLKSPGLLERLVEHQQGYLLDLFSGEYGEDYVQSRIRVGQRHFMISLPPQWYLSAYGLWMEILLEELEPEIERQGLVYATVQAALSRLVFRDLSLVLDAWFAAERQSQKDLEQAREALSLAKAQRLVDEKQAMLGRLTGGIVHDANNLLTIILAHLEFIHQELIDDGANQQDVIELKEIVQRAVTLNQTLLELARRGPCPPRPTALDGVILSLMQIIKRVLYQNITLELGETPLAMIDSVRLERVLLNLLLNAAEALPQSGHIWIRTHTQEGPQPILLEIRDNGPGIPASLLPHVFDLHVSTRNENASGVGLSTCRQLIEEIGGRIEVHSHPGEGTVFRVHLLAALFVNRFD